jgi:hypothetical protein
MRVSVTPAAALLALALAYLGTQLVLFDEQRYLDYDEAIYLSQVTPQKTAWGFDAHRSRGITWLLLPATSSEAALSEVRAYLAILSAALLAWMFGIWLPFLGWATPLAAGLYGFSWLALFYGSEIMPNHFFALLAVGTAGALARSFEFPPWRWLILSSILMSVAASIRPTDSLVFAGGLVLATVIAVGRKNIWHVLPPLLGLVLGWTPWINEAFSQFGGPLERYRTSSKVVSDLGINIFRHLSTTSGELLGTLPTIPVAGALWWASLVGFSIVAFKQTKGRSALRPLIFATLGAVLISIPYFFLTRGVQAHLLAPVIAPRFLLPVYALISIVAAAGIGTYLSAPEDTRQRRLVKTGATLLLLGVGGAWHLQTADQVEAEQFGLRERPRLIGAALQKLAHGEPCVFASNFPSPDIQFASDCLWQPFPLARAQTAQALEDLANATSRVFVVARAASARGKPFRSWQSTPVDGTPGWIVFAPPKVDLEAVAN